MRSIFIKQARGIYSSMREIFIVTKFIKKIAQNMNASLIHLTKERTKDRVSKIIVTVSLSINPPLFLN